MVQVGRTIAERWEKQESESERLIARQKKQRKKWLSAGIYLTLVAVAILGGILWARAQFFSTPEEVLSNNNWPIVEIIDENGAGVSSRMEEFVGELAADLAELGFGVERAVVPASKVREIDVFLVGYNFYVKTNLDRGAGVSAEDVARMVRYLEDLPEMDLVSVEYIDVRVEGKGWWK